MTPVNGSVISLYQRPGKSPRRDSHVVQAVSDKFRDMVDLLRIQSRSSKSHADHLLDDDGITFSGEPQQYDIRLSGREARRRKYTTSAKFRGSQSDLIQQGYLSPQRRPIFRKRSYITPSLQAKV
jgi:hypothetical protein